MEEKGDGKKGEREGEGDNKAAAAMRGWVGITGEGLGLR